MGEGLVGVSTAGHFDRKPLQSTVELGFGVTDYAPEAYNFRSRRPSRASLPAAYAFAPIWTNMS